MDTTRKSELSTSPLPKRTAKLETLLKQRKELEARIAAAEAKAKEAERKARTRRAIILGEAVIAAIQRGDLAAVSDGVWVPIQDPKAWVLSQPLRSQDVEAWRTFSESVAPASE